jgi:hypothetical protein
LDKETVAPIILDEKVVGADVSAPLGVEECVLERMRVLANLVAEQWASNEEARKNGGLVVVEEIEDKDFGESFLVDDIDDKGVWTSFVVEEIEDKEGPQSVVVEEVEERAGLSSVVGEEIEDKAVRLDLETMEHGNWRPHRATLDFSCSSCQQNIFILLLFARLL